MSADFTPWSGLAGGLLIGVAAVLLLVANGRIAGVSGIAGGLLGASAGDRAWRVAFVLGLPLGALAYGLAAGPIELEVDAPLLAVLAAGLLVGFGTRLGSGCTSGHGVCGIARLSLRSIVATGVFMAAGIATVFVARHIL